MYDNPDAEAVPAGDIGNHVVPEVIIISTGVVALLAVVIRLMSRYILRKLGIVEILLIISMVRLSLSCSSPLTWQSGKVSLTKQFY